MPKDVAGLIGLFNLTQTGENTWMGPQPDTLFQRLFGGQVLGQTLVAAALSVPAGREVHSLGAYFLRPGDPKIPLRFDVEAVRDGGTMSSRRVVTSQGDSTIFVLQASFHAAEEGLEHTARQPTEGLAPAEAAPSLRGILEERFGSNLQILSEWDALDVRLAQEPVVDESGSHLRAWVRTKSAMPDDPLLHKAVLAYLSDITLLSVATIPHGVQLMSPKLAAASIDHSMWFHRPVRVDDWMLYDMRSPTASGARGFCTGLLYQDDRLIATAAQEGLLRLV